MKKQMLIWVLSWIIVFTGSLQAAAPPAESQKEPVKVTGDHIYGDHQKEWAVVEGNVVITQEETILKTERARIDLKQKTAVLKGRVLLNHPEVSIKAARLEYNYQKKRGTFYEKVRMEREEVRDSQGKITKEAFVLEASKLYFESETKNFKAEKGELRSKDFLGKGNLIEYNDNKQELFILDEAYLKKDSGEEVRGQEIKIDLKENTFTVQKNVIINIEIEDEEKP